MNQIYLGQRAYGFAVGQRDLLRQAAEGHHGRRGGDARRPAEGAVGVQPDRQPAAGDDRASSYIIDRMLDNGFITAEQHEAARKQMLRYRTPSEVAVHAEYVAETARQLIFSQYGDEAYTRGLNVYLTLELGRADGRLPRAAQGHHGLRAAPGLPRPRGLRRPAGRPDGARRAHRRGAAGPSRQRRAASAAVVHRGVAEEGRRRAAERRGDHGHRRRPEAGRPRASSPKANPKTQIRPGAVVRADPAAPRATGSLTQLPEVEGAFVAIDPRTGAIRAMVGGFDYSKSKFNHVTQAWRQPGSSFKPFIYSAALEKGFTPATVINDAPLFFDAGATGSQPWEPKNYDGTFDGPMTLRRGAGEVEEHDLDPHPASRSAPPYAQQWITRFGFDADKHPGLPDDGARRRLGDAAADGVGLQRVRQRRLSRQPAADQPHHRHQGPRAATRRSAPVLDESMRTLDARNAFVMTSLLQEVTRSRHRGARRRRTLKRPDIYGKTGTTNDSHRRLVRRLPAAASSRSSGSATTSRASSATARPAAASRCRSGSTT